jgi:hypothetical protein
MIVSCVATRQTSLTLPSQAGNGSFWQTIASYGDCADNTPNSIVGYPFLNNQCTIVKAGDDLATQYGAQAGGAMSFSCNVETNVVTVRACSSPTCDGQCAPALTPKTCTLPSKAAFGCIQKNYVKEVPTTVAPTQTVAPKTTIVPAVVPTPPNSGVKALAAGLLVAAAMI